jgi:hypothetical protein
MSLLGSIHFCQIFFFFSFLLLFIVGGQILFSRWKGHFIEEMRSQCPKATSLQNYSVLSFSMNYSLTNSLFYVLWFHGRLNAFRAQSFTCSGLWCNEVLNSLFTAHTDQKQQRGKQLSSWRHPLTQRVVHEMSPSLPARSQPCASAKITQSPLPKMCCSQLWACEVF